MLPATSPSTKHVDLSHGGVPVNKPTEVYITVQLCVHTLLLWPHVTQTDELAG